MRHPNDNRVVMCYACFQLHSDRSASTWDSARSAEYTIKDKHRYWQNCFYCKRIYFPYPYPRLIPLNKRDMGLVDEGDHNLLML